VILTTREAARIPGKSFFIALIMSRVGSLAILEHGQQGSTIAIGAYDIGLNGIAVPDLRDVLNGCSVNRLDGQIVQVSHCVSSYTLYRTGSRNAQE
jgi:hypothetical protein